MFNFLIPSTKFVIMDPYMLIFKGLIYTNSTSIRLLMSHVIVTDFAFLHKKLKSSDALVSYRGIKIKETKENVWMSLSAWVIAFALWPNIKTCVFRDQSISGTEFLLDMILVKTKHKDKDRSLSKLITGVIWRERY